MTRPAPLKPAVRDPVVLDGTKYRIRILRDGLACVRTSFGGDPPREVWVDRLAWDAVAGVWRLAR